VAFIHFSGPARPSLGDVRSTKVLGHDVRMIAIESQAAETAYVDQFDESVATVQAALRRARELLSEGEYGLVVLDDINPLLDQGTIEEAAVRDLIVGKPESATIVLTGRFAPAWVLQIADIVTDFAEVKHPVHVGVGPRKGIEF
jgi:ATP:corrinoid adenosyltransferase